MGTSFKGRHSERVVLRTLKSLVVDSPAMKPGAMSHDPSIVLAEAQYIPNIFNHHFESSAFWLFLSSDFFSSSLSPDPLPLPLYWLPSLPGSKTVLPIYQVNC